MRGRAPSIQTYLAISLLALPAASCTARTPPPQPNPQSQPQPQPQPKPQPQPNPAAEVDWDAIAFVGDNVLLPSSKPVPASATLHVLDGENTVELELPEAQACDVEQSECQQIWLEREDAWATPFHTIGLSSLSDDVMLDDIVLLPYRIGSLGALPAAAAARIEVRYFNALCPNGESGEWVTVGPVTSEGGDPLAEAAFGPKLKDWARRVISVRMEGRSLHFVHGSKLSLPKSTRMADLPGQHTEALWIVLETDAGVTLLEERELETRRSINHDYSCELPIQFPVPFAVVERDNELVLFATEGLGTYIRFRLRGDVLTEEARYQLGAAFSLF